jgi:hypothetical protein
VRPKQTSALVPAAARPPTALADHEAILSAHAIDTFTKILGGKDLLADVLAVASHDPDVDKVVTLLLDPAYASYSLARLCHLAGITAADLYSALGKASIARAKIEAIVTEVAPKLRGVVKDVMDRAQPYEIPCTACGGVGATTAEPTKEQPNPAPQACAVCRGGGKLLALPDLDRQKLALELGQLVSKGGGIAVQVNQQNLGDRAGSTQTGALEQLQQALGEILFDGPPPTAPLVEGEVVDSAPPPAAASGAEA